jgi:hypothetical protein
MLQGSTCSDQNARLRDIVRWPHTDKRADCDVRAGNGEQRIVGGGDQGMGPLVAIEVVEVLDSFRASRSQRRCMRSPSLRNSVGTSVKSWMR